MTTPTLHTTRAAAAYLGLSVQRVKQLASALGVGQRIGRDWVFTDADLTRLAATPRKPGSGQRKEREA